MRMVEKARRRAQASDLYFGFRARRDRERFFVFTAFGVFIFSWSRSACIWAMRYE
jgi:hypothetical protein